MDMKTYSYFVKVRMNGKTRYVTIPYQIAPPNDFKVGQMVKVTLEIL